MDRELAPHVLPGATGTFTATCTDAIDVADNPQAAPAAVTARAFQCSIKPPRAVRTGKSHPYLITATENLGAGSHAAPAVGHAVNPEIIYFS
jgi:hypothetical protein